LIFGGRDGGGKGGFVENIRRLKAGTSDIKRQFYRLDSGLRRNDESKKHEIQLPFLGLWKERLLVKAFVGVGLFLGFLSFMGCERGGVPSDTTVIDRFAILPDEKIDVGLASLQMEKQLFPKINVEAYSEKIDEIPSMHQTTLL